MRALFLLPLLAACGDEDPAAHACEHVAEAGEAVTAAVDADEAPAVGISDEPWTVSLDADESTHVRIDVDEELDALLYVDTPDVITGLSLDGAAQTLPAPAPNDDCPDALPEHYDLELTPGTWTLTLAPAAVDSVWMMLVEAGGHAH